jgi:hypothetical protein
MTYKLLLALTALAIIMVAGCNQPVGVPCEYVRAASTVYYCTVDNNDAWTG